MNSKSFAFERDDPEHVRRRISIRPPLLSTGFRRRLRILPALVAACIASGSILGAAARADTIGPVEFEPPGFSSGSLDGQQGWTHYTPPSDVAVAELADFPDAAGLGFDLQALRLSNASGATMSGALSAAVGDVAGEETIAAPWPTLEYGFSIATTTTVEQPGLAMSVSAIGPLPSRMTFLRFDEAADGVHVVFIGADNPGPLGTVTDFPEEDVATLARGEAHSVRVLVHLVDGSGGTGPGNDVVKVYVDGDLVHVGGSWENYYRYDPEQVVNGNVVPPLSRLFFRVGGPFPHAPATAGNGFLVDHVRVQSAPLAPLNTTAPALAGEPAVGGQLSCSPGTWMQASLQLTYQWLLDGAEIAGAGGPSYTVRGEDAGHAVSCRVTAVNDLEASAVATSGAVAIAAPPPPPDAPPPPAPPARIKPEKGAAPLTGAGAAIATVQCTGGSTCTIAAPRTVKVKIGGKTYAATVASPKKVGAGKAAKVRIKLSKAALKALRQTRSRQTRVVVKLTVTSDAGKLTKTVRRTLKAPATR